jgi:hypothetical protein
MRTGLALAALGIVGMTVAAPAAGRHKPLPAELDYYVIRGSGFTRLDFHGNPAAGCAEHGVCGVSGRVTYSFGGPAKRGTLYFLSGIHRKLYFGVAGFKVRGSTNSETSTAGSPERCVDTVAHRDNLFLVERVGRAVRVTLESARATPQSEDYLATHCPGPDGQTLTAAHVAAATTVPVRSFLPRRLTLHVAGRTPFSGGGYSGTLERDATYRLIQQPCSPGCLAGFD